MTPGKSDKGSERRIHPRHKARIDVNYRRGETYLFSRTENLSELGIFLVAEEPFEAGTTLELRFLLQGEEPIDVMGEVMWVEPRGSRRVPGMGIRFVDPSPRVRERVRTLIRTIAYLE